MTTLPQAAALAKKLATEVAADARDVRIEIEDSRISDLHAGHDGAVTRRDGTRRRVATTRWLHGRWLIEVTEQDLAEAPAPTVEPRTSELVAETVVDPTNGHPSRHVLGVHYQETIATTTVLHDDGVLSQWEHCRRRLWHWLGGPGGHHLEGTVTWGHLLPDPAVPRERRLELLAVRDARDTLHGRMPVLLRPQVAMHLVAVLADMLNGQNALAGMRMLRERKARQIASPCVTVVDDGGLDGPYGALVDDEGVATARNVLVETGVLRGFLHSRTTAAACGDPPNGCALRDTQDGHIRPGPRNFAILPGAEDPLTRMDSGLDAVALGRRAERVGGGKRVRLEVFGWAIRDGERRYPVGPVSVETGLFSWLRAVACGPSLHHSALFRGLAAPSLLLPETDVRDPA